MKAIKLRLLLMLMLCAKLSFAQQQVVLDPYERKWALADSLLLKGLPKRAVAVVQAVYDDAHQHDQSVYQLKAMLYLIHANLSGGERADTQSINIALRQAAITEFPTNNIWHSIAAELYWNYYSRDRYTILQRTKVADPEVFQNIEEWDARQYFRTIAYHYKASLKGANDLIDIPIGDYQPVVLPGKNTKQLRPTLFDLLAFRAIQYYENDEQETVQPAYQFVISDTTMFNSAASFCTLSYTTKDTLSAKFKTIRLYQGILTLHLQDKVPDALLDADLHRLAFVYRHAVMNDKKALYQKALQRVVAHYPNNHIGALAGFRLLEFEYEYEFSSYHYNDQKHSSRDTINLRPLKQKLDSIIINFSGSEVAALARERVNDLLSKRLSIETEQVVLPNEYSKILLSYKNISNVSFRVVKIDDDDHYSNDSARKLFFKKIPLHEWQERLPQTSDLRQHNVEIKIDPLEIGKYAVIAHEGSGFASDSNILVLANFQVSHLACMLTDSNAERKFGYVLDRKSGQPIFGADVSLEGEEYDSLTCSYKVEHYRSKKDGSFNAKSNSANYQIEISYHGDTISASNYPERRNYNDGTEKEDTTTIFFTDRSIYRPGQTVYFKAIVLHPTAKGWNVCTGTSNDFVASNTSNIEFFSKTYPSSEFGSYSGSFTIPSQTLAGEWTIADDHGKLYFQVEEYKRPKFEIVFDSLKNSFQPDDSVKVLGEAIAFAGNNIGNAEVKYLVTRSVRYPYYERSSFWGRPEVQDIQVAEGTTNTREDGRFVIPFKAFADDRVPKKSLPQFRYKVAVDVTDLNGETRSSSVSVVAGYHDFDISAWIYHTANHQAPNKLEIITANLNGLPVTRKVRVQIAQLKTDTKLYRKRLWSDPDQFVMDSTAFVKLFPDDRYGSEPEQKELMVQQITFDTSVLTIEGMTLDIPVAVWPMNGSYRINISAVDAHGQQIEYVAYETVESDSLEGVLKKGMALAVTYHNEPEKRKVDIRIKTEIDSVYLLRLYSSNEYDSHAASFHYAKPGENFSIGYKDKLLSFSLRYLYVKDNRVYQHQKYVVTGWNGIVKMTLATHRKHLEPGNKEQWMLTLTGKEKEKLSAEVVGTLYDASLDQLKRHTLIEGFESLHYDLRGSILAEPHYGSWRKSEFSAIEFDKHTSDELVANKRFYQYFTKQYDELLTPLNLRSKLSFQAPITNWKDPSSVGGIKTSQTIERNFETPPQGSVEQIQEDYGGKMPYEQKLPMIIPRKKLQETAFFFPQLRTDSTGIIKIAFTIPEALTRWKFIALAHTKDARFGYITDSVITQKPLMVQPNLPRFLRQGDDVEIATKIVNLTGAILGCTTVIDILDAKTERSVLAAFGVKADAVAFTLGKTSSVRSWKIHVPENYFDPVIVRITARAGNFTDGEDNTLAILANKVLVTETMPIWMNGSEAKNFTFNKLLQSEASTSLSQFKVTAEYTTNPTWYAIQTLPYLMEYPYECAEQTFNRYYANAIAAHILNKVPKAKAIFDSWKQTIDSTGFKSNLDRNPELKSALQEETPWVLDANEKAERERNIALLFDSYKLNTSRDADMKKLENMRVAGGGFPWFESGSTNRYITQYIATGISRLKQLGIKDQKADLLLSSMMPYLSREFLSDYNKIHKAKSMMEGQTIGPAQIQYLYLKSFSSKPQASNPAITYYLEQAAQYWPNFNAYMKGMIAISLRRMGDSTTANNILSSLLETSSYNEETGRYWANPHSTWWYDAPVEAQSLLIECFTEAKDLKTANELKTWLIKQKQAQDWKTTKATADACYALLLNGAEWLDSEPKVTLKLGNRLVAPSGSEAGTGYFQQTFTSGEIKPEMGNVSVKLNSTRRSSNPSYGAIYWQYFEGYDKITAVITPLSLRKQLFIERITDQGKVLEEIKTDNSLKVGDKVTIRIMLHTDRDMEYLHLKDMRAACFEPVNVLSGYRYQGGLAYYESAKDASTNFFIDYLRIGTYVFEYSVHVIAKGTYSNGISTFQCMYAPEFSSHSEGLRVVVK